MKLIKSADRYLTQIEWLKSYHSFSFGEHYHPDNRGWGNLRVINEDFIAPGGIFDTHPHRDMEIISYLVKGELFHKDSAGNEYKILAGDVQRISAGSGISHSEENTSTDQEAQLLQLWIVPEEKQTKPNYAQKTFPKEAKRNKLQLLVSKDAKEDSISIKQNIDLYASILDKDQEIKVEMKNNKAWIQLIEGLVQVNNMNLHPGDAAAFDKKQSIDIKSLKPDSHFLLFDIDS